MVGTPQADLGEYISPLEQFKGSGKKREGVVILHCDIV